MGTRGAYGFYVDGKTKVTYNHFDSYPEGLGSDVVNFIVLTPDEELGEIARRIQMVDDDKKPTHAQIEECRKWADQGVSSGRLDEWYVLLRDTQGNLGLYKQGLNYMIDSENFLLDSLFCEWAYIINVDTGKLEVYRGFNKDKDAPGRYACLRLDDYCGVSLLAEVPFSELREKDTCDFLEAWKKLASR